MKHEEFEIGCEFVCPCGSGKRWKCTDKGTRTIAAIRLYQGEGDWYTGPPYTVVEFTFDEYDIEDCCIE